MDSRQDTTREYCVWTESGGDAGADFGWSYSAAAVGPAQARRGRKPAPVCPAWAESSEMKGARPQEHKSAVRPGAGGKLAGNSKAQKSSETHPIRAGRHEGKDSVPDQGRSSP